MDNPLKVHVFCFSKKDNGGESLILKTSYYHNGDDHGGVYTNQELTLNSYCNHATIGLYSISITPEMLRRLANELEASMSEAKTLTVGV